MLLAVLTGLTGCIMVHLRNKELYTSETNSSHVMLFDGEAWNVMPISSIQTQVSKQIDRVSKLMKKHHDNLVAVWTASVRKFDKEQTASTSTTNKRLVNAHTDTKRKVVSDAKHRVTIDAMKQIAQKKPKCHSTGGRRRRSEKRRC